MIDKWISLKLEFIKKLKDPYNKFKNSSKTY